MITFENGKLGEGMNMKTVIQKSRSFNKHGGHRPGSGRKKADTFWKGEVVSVRLNQTLSKNLEAESKRTGKSRSKLIQQAIYKLYHPMGDILG